MPRPRSETKRQALLEAAIAMLDEQGLSAPTARIAKAAGVAEGTLFTYFPSKEVLFNELYLHLKTILRDEFVPDFPRSGSLRERMAFVWARYVGWGASSPASRKALTLLGHYEGLTRDTREAGQAMFAVVGEVLIELVPDSGNGCSMPHFMGAVIESLAQTTVEFIWRYPEQAESYQQMGFEAMWNALTAGKNPQS